MYGQQKDIANFNNDISKLKKRLSDLENELEANIDKDNQKPPHY